MPYVNIKQSKLAPKISKIVGKLEGELAGKVQKDISDSRKKFSSRCPDQAELARIGRKTDQLNRAVDSFEKRVRAFKKIPPPLKRIAKTILRIVKLLKGLPIPQGFPKPFGLPMGVDMKFADLLHKAKEFGTQLNEDAETIENILQGTAGATTTAKSAVSALDGPIRACTIANALGREDLSARVPLLLNIDRDGNLLTLGSNGFPVLFDPDLLTGDIGNNGAPTVINNSDSPVIPVYIDSETGEALDPSLIESILNGGGDISTGTETETGGAGTGAGTGTGGAGTGVGTGSISDTPISVTSVTSKNNYKRTGEFNQNTVYSDNKGRKNTITYNGKEYLTNNSLKNGKSGWGIPGESNDWKEVDLKELKSTKDLIRAEDGNLYSEGAFRRNLLDLQNILDGLNKSSLSEEQIQAVEVLSSRLNLKDVKAPEGDIVPYKDYFIEIVQDPEDFGLAPRRFAVAKDKEGIILLRGPKSFSSSTDILVEELKFRIDNQLP